MHNIKTAWVYILECGDGSYYTGSTTDLETRIAKHQAGFYGGYTAARLPIKLIWSAEFPEIKQAIVVEWQIKGWSHKKKEALIQGDFDLLHALAQSREMKGRRNRKGRRVTAGE